jgi:hypothetical protein
MSICAIDPGSRMSAYVVNDDTLRPITFAKVANEDLLAQLPEADCYVIEMVASYGMAVGEEVFETVRWIGRFEQALTAQGAHPDLVKRLPVKVHLCHSPKANDSNVRQALVDRFAPGQPNHGKGTKTAPGWFYGFHADIWQAFALAVYAADTQPGARGVPALSRAGVSTSTDAFATRAAVAWRLDQRAAAAANREARLVVDLARATGQPVAVIRLAHGLDQPLSPPAPDPGVVTS